jgi:hypothetical protein
MASSRYWFIEYAPVYIEAEGCYMLGIIQARMNKLTHTLGGSIGCHAHIQVRNDDDGACYHVLALIDTQTTMTEAQFRTLMLHECREQRANAIRSELLDERMYAWLCKDYNAYVFPNPCAI